MLTTIATPVLAQQCWDLRNPRTPFAAFERETHTNQRMMFDLDRFVTTPRRRHAVAPPPPRASEPSLNPNHRLWMMAMLTKN